VGQGGPAGDERRAVLLRQPSHRALELRRNGHTVVDLLKDHPELRLLGIASAFAYAAGHRDRYAEFFDPDGSLAGPGCTDAEAAVLPESLRVPGVVIKIAAPA
jgi:hypothetical protein